MSFLTRSKGRFQRSGLSGKKRAFPVCVLWCCSLVLFLPDLGCQRGDAPDDNPTSAAQEAQPDGQQPVAVYTGEFPAWDSLRSMLMPGWGLSNYWDNKKEICAYYETRIENGEKKQWESHSELYRESFSNGPGTAAELLWRYRWKAGDPEWPELSGWFSVNPYPKPRSWQRQYPSGAAERFGDPGRSLPYGIRSYLSEEGIPTDLPLGQGLLSADQLPFLLRSLVFLPENSGNVLIYPTPRRAMPELANPLNFDLVVTGTESLSFLDQTYETYRVVLRVGEREVERYWFERSYPNVMVRWENMTGESRMLKSVRYETAVSD